MLSLCPIFSFENSRYLIHYMGALVAIAGLLQCAIHQSTFMPSASAQSEGMGVLKDC